MNRVWSEPETSRYLFSLISIILTCFCLIWLNQMRPDLTRPSLTWLDLIWLDLIRPKLTGLAWSGLSYLFCSGFSWADLFYWINLVEYWKPDMTLCFVVVVLRGLTFEWRRCYSVCQRHEPTELAHSFIILSCVYFCLYDPFNCISFHIFSRQFSVFSLCSSSLISALSVLSTIYVLWQSSSALM